MPPHLIIVLIESILLLLLGAKEAQNDRNHYDQYGYDPYHQIDYLVFLIPFRYLVTQVILTKIGNTFKVLITIVSESFVALAYLVLCTLATVETHCFAATVRLVLVFAILVSLALIYALPLLHTHIVFRITASRHALIAKFTVISIRFHP